MKNLLLAILLLSCTSSFGQQKIHRNYFLKVRTGLSTPLKGEYLKEYYSPGPYFSANFGKEGPFFFILIGADYEYIRFFSSDKVRFYRPYLGIGKTFNLFETIGILPSVNVGYSWINHKMRGEGLHPDQIILSQEAISASFDLCITRKIGENIEIGFGDSYMIIFDSYGLEINKPDNSKYIAMNRLFLNAAWRF